jgi:hypothetical protein
MSIISEIVPMKDLNRKPIALLRFRASLILILNEPNWPSNWKTSRVSKAISKP